MGYVNNVCISLFKKEETEKQLKEYEYKTLSYIAQGVQMISNNTAFIPAYCGKSEDAQVLVPFIDYIENKPQDERTADEIVDDVLANCGFLGG